MASVPPLPHGVLLRPLEVHADDRGQIAEFFRNQWSTIPAPVQWTGFVTEAGVMRGVHVHLRHDDYLVLLNGRVELGLRDLRPGSPSSGCTAMLELGGGQPTAILIPHGVAHGLLCTAHAAFVIGSSHYYDRADELGCHWLDPDLGLVWPRREARLSARDAALPSLRELAAHIPAWEHAGR